MESEWETEQTSMYIMPYGVDFSSFFSNKISIAYWMTDMSQRLSKIGWDTFMLTEIR